MPYESIAVCTQHNQRVCGYPRGEGATPILITSLWATWTIMRFVLQGFGVRMFGLKISQLEDSLN